MRSLPAYDFCQQSPYGLIGAVESRRERIGKKKSLQLAVREEKVAWYEDVVEEIESDYLDLVWR